MGSSLSSQRRSKKLKKSKHSHKKRRCLFSSSSSESIKDYGRYQKGVVGWCEGVVYLTSLGVQLI